MNLVKGLKSLDKLTLSMDPFLFFGLKLLISGLITETNLCNSNIIPQQYYFQNLFKYLFVWAKNTSLSKKWLNSEQTNSGKYKHEKHAPVSSKQVGSKTQSLTSSFTSLNQSLIEFS